MPVKLQHVRVVALHALHQHQLVVIDAFAYARGYRAEISIVPRGIVGITAYGGDEVGSLSWGWGATVTNNGGTYVLANRTNSNQSTKSYSTTEPVWNSINGNLGSGCHSLPTH